MALQIPLVSVNVGAVSMEAFLYGVYLVLFVASMYLLATHYARSQPRVGRDTSTLKTPVFLGPICLFMMITAVREDSEHVMFRVDWNNLNSALDYDSRPVFPGFCLFQKWQYSN
jgi:hypothetical protein